MKKKLFALMLCAALCVLAVLMTACGEDPPPETPHTHTYGEWTQTKAATCVAEGEQTRYCSGCDATERQAIPATGIHVYGADNACIDCGVRLAYTEGLVLTPIENGAAYAVTHIGTATAEQIVLPAYHEGKPVKALQGLLVSDGITSPQRVTGLEIPATMTFVDPKALEGTALSSLTVAGGNAVYHSSGNCLIETATKTLVAGCLTSSIPANGTVTAIGSYAFYKNVLLTALNVPHTVTAIAPNAFDGCEALVSIVLQSNDATADTTQPNPLLDGWHVSETADETAPIAVDVSSGATAARLLTDTYKAYYWYRDAADDSARY